MGSSFVDGTLMAVEARSIAKDDPDGGLTLYIQADSPETDKQANWLSAPKGLFMLTVRYYWPKAELLNGDWKSPPVRRVP